MKQPLNHLKHLFISCLLLSSTIQTVQGQEFYRPLDTLDMSFFISGIAANILPKDRVEILTYSSINSYWLAIHQSPLESPVRDRLRVTQFTTNVEGYFGFSNSQRWDLGLRLQYARYRLDNEARSSPFRVFENLENPPLENGLDQNYHGLTGVGLRARVLPIASVPSLTINAGYTVASVKSEEKQQRLNAQRDILDLGIAYFIDLNPNNYYYFLANTSAYLPSETLNQSLYSSSVSFFMVHLAFGQKLVLYPGLSYHLTYKPPTYGNGFLVKTNEQLLAFGGIQYQPSSNFNISLSLAYPLVWKDNNLLVEQVGNSYSYASLGLRVLL